MALQLSVDRDQLTPVYIDLCVKNPLLARLEGQVKSYGWTDLEIRTLQLIAACNSNASLHQRIQDLEAEISLRVNSPQVIAKR